MKKDTFLGVIIGLGITMVILIVWNLLPGTYRPVITSFNQCAAQGYPILESYPRQCKTPDGRTFVEKVNNNGTNPPSTTVPTTTPPNNNNQNFSDLIKIDIPQKDATINSPVMVKGQARGTWYFEASFPAHVVDANGQTLGTAPVQAKGDWMTSEFVPFEGSIPFSSPTTPTGFVIFENDNPSGLRENSKQVRVPVIFQNVQATTTLKVFFNNRTKLTTGQDDCTTVFAVERTVSSTPAIGRAALLELLKGVTSSEQAKGFTTSLGSGVQIQSLSIENGIARVDFNSALDQNIGGSCRVAAIRAQITQTLKQFSTVQQVIISRNGSLEDVLQP